MATQVTLSEELQARIARLMETRGYGSAEDVIDDCVRVLEAERDELTPDERAKIAAAITEADRDGDIPAAEVFAELRARFGAA